MSDGALRETSSEHAPAEDELCHCSICLMLFCEPVSLNCGHTFCRICLYRAFNTAAAGREETGSMIKPCPICRSPSSIDPRTCATNFALKALVASLQPDQHRLRMEEYTQESQHLFEPSSSTPSPSTPDRLPLFLLHNFQLFPHQPAQLMVFEPRYKLMIRRLLASGPRRRFGLHWQCHPPHRSAGAAVVWQPTGGGAPAGSFGTVFEISDVREVGDGSGRLLLRGRGAERYRLSAAAIEEANTGGLYHGEVEPFQDEISADGNAVAVSQTVALPMLTMCRHTIRSVRRRLTQRQRDELRQRYGDMPSSIERLVEAFGRQQQQYQHQRNQQPQPTGHRLTPAQLAADLQSATFWLASSTRASQDARSAMWGTRSIVERVGLLFESFPRAAAAADDDDDDNSNAERGGARPPGGGADLFELDSAGPGPFGTVTQSIMLFAAIAAVSYIITFLDK